ncbi:MAG: hypothetical protein PHR56_08020 [Dehalococcoidales bacterium]|nr:hypothetical protein [Dehalococcoidales bacterium]
MKRWVLISVLAIAGMVLFYSLGLTADKLEGATTNLAAAQNELDSVRIELDATKMLVETSGKELASAQSTLDLAKNELAAAKNSLSGLRTELAATVANFTAKVAELQATRDELNRQRTELTSLQTSYQALVSGHGYTVKDPTYQQMLDFLKTDTTDQKSYIVGRYECRHFATDVCNSAELAGIRCAYVSLGYPQDMGHAIVAFNTIDKGLVYVEPQSDEQVKVVMGRHYFQCVIPNGNYSYVQPPYDDTILEILVAW